MDVEELKREVTQLELAELGLLVLPEGERIFRRLCFQYTVFRDAEEKKQKLLRRRTRGEGSRPR